MSYGRKLVRPIGYVEPQKTPSYAVNQAAIVMKVTEETKMTLAGYNQIPAKDRFSFGGEYYVRLIVNNNPVWKQVIFVKK